jgi:hypothetical protein
MQISMLWCNHERTFTRKEEINFFALILAFSWNNLHKQNHPEESEQRGVISCDAMATKAEKCQR